MLINEDTTPLLKLVAVEGVVVVALVSVVVAAVVDSSKNGTFYFLGQVVTITFLSRSKLFIVFFEHDTGLKVQLHNWKELFCFL